MTEELLNNNNEVYTPSKEDFEFVQQDTNIKDEKFETKPIGYFRDALRRFIRNKASVVAAVILFFLLAMAIFVPVFSNSRKFKDDPKISFLPPKISKNTGIQIVEKALLTNLDNPDYYPLGSYEKLSEPFEENGVWYVKLRFDPYKKALGRRRLTSISEIQLADLKKRNVKHTIVKKVIDKIPIDGTIVEIPSYEIEVENYYEYLGYSKMPYFLFGTDSTGGDLFYKSWKGLRISLLIGIVVAVINLSIGILWGAISGYYGGTVDIVMERIVEIISGVPWIVVMSIAVLLLGRRLTTVMLSIVLTSWIGTASIVRAQFYRYKGQEYILAARTLGASDWRIMTKHILPNAIGPVVTSAVLVIPSAVFIEANLSYLGIGLNEIGSLGIILSSGQSVIVQYPHLTIYPAIIISLLMISFNLFGNGLRDAFNPSLRGIE